jgi:mannose-6-phosphate isomerase-like protein (cupin superfamily)
MVIPSIVNPEVLTEQRPWGIFERYSLNEPTTVKLIMVEANKRLSLQYHNNRDEFWAVKVIPFITPAASLALDDKAL